MMLPEMFLIYLFIGVMSLLLFWYEVAEQHQNSTNSIQLAFWIVVFFGLLWPIGVLIQFVSGAIYFWRYRINDISKMS